MPISEGRVEGDQMKFKVVRESQRGTFTMDYKGKIKGETITGAIALSMGDRSFEREFVMKRKPADVVGKWAWVMERDNGENWEATMTIKKEGEQLVGTMGREDFDWSVEMKDLKVTGNKMTYKTVMARDGNEFVIKSSAVVDGDKMKGKSGGERNGETWSREWKATRQKQ